MTVSAVIPTYNRGYLLRKTFERLQFLTWPDQVIVVDDGGDDDTQEVCAEFGAEYVYNHNPGWSNRCLATNVGIKLAKHDEILLTDAETAFLTDVVAQFLAFRDALPSNILTASWCFRAIGDGKYEMTPGGGVGLYRREWLEEVGGYDEDFPAPTGWDDADLHKRLAFNGYVQQPVPQTVVVHQAHDTHPWNEPGQHVVNPNLARFEAKELPRDLVANEGREWGRLRVR